MKNILPLVVSFDKIVIFMFYFYYCCSALIAISQTRCRSVGASI